MLLLNGQDVKSISQKGLIDILNSRNDTTYVVNFWATWCSPCVAEIGFFEDLHRKTLDKKLKVILINLDFPNQVNKRVDPFISKKNLSAEIINMTELDYNSWISLVDSSWSGAIPATLIFQGDNKKFFEKEMSRQELFSEVSKFINL